jgi:hypothetical protein
MKMLFESGASGTAPTPPSPGSAGYPSDGNLSTSTPPTIPGAYAFYQLFAELLHVITAAGLTPDASNVTQLKSALDTLYASSGAYLTTANFTGGNQSLAANGYQRLPGGLILQWGTASVAFGTTQTVTFPTTFPNACRSVITQVPGYTSVAVETLGAPVTITAANFTLHHAWCGDVDGTPIDPASFMWFALGY